MRHHYRMDILKSYANINRLLGSFDITYRLTYSGNVLCLVIRNLNVEFFLKFHDQLYSVQGIRPKVVGKASFRNNFVLINTQFINDDGLYS
ncbi:hypothetical protein NOC27_3437 [Nitrosococcus oceani AFC27]|nr:hypothetical protein NOC27_3437 [Nitrosococcus oceani AFC27]